MTQLTLPACSSGRPVLAGDHCCVFLPITIADAIGRATDLSRIRGEVLPEPETLKFINHFAARPMRPEDRVFAETIVDIAWTRIDAVEAEFRQDGEN